MQYLIGVDIGTSGTKTVLFDTDGKSIASCTVEYGLSQPQNGWAEQNPNDWWEASAQGIHECMFDSGISPSAVAGIGLSGQMHGLVMLDGHDEVIRPSIIWCDQRTQAECVQITEGIGSDRLIEITANPALTGFTASKIQWIKNHEPENFMRCEKIMLPKDYIRYMLTGEFAAEVSDASGMQLLDVPRRVWSSVMMDFLGIKASQLGKMYESCEVTGVLTQSAAEKCGLCAGIPVVGGAGDQAAAAVGNGIVCEGIASASIGTSGVVFVHSDKITIDPKGRVHTFCHAIPGAWHVMGVTQGAGLSFKWMRDNFFGDIVNAASDIGKNANALLDEIAGNIPCGSNGLVYLPYLMGERTPHLDPDCRGVFFGLSAVHTRRDMLRAVLEGVIYSLYDCVNVINGMGISTETIFASGGGGNSRLWRQIMADVFGKPISLNSSKEGGALGAAILAGVGAGIYSDVPTACGQLIRPTLSTEPVEKNKETYSEYYELYGSLYNSLKDNFKYLKKINK